jgi:acyl carrier protein
MTTSISSRTPDGVPNHCPICDTSICIEPSTPPGDAPCPNCGHLLWFFTTSAGIQFLDSKPATPLKDKIVQIQKRAFPTTAFHEAVGGASLDIVELIMTLEEEFNITIPDDDAMKIKTIEDAIYYIAKHNL